MIDLGDLADVAIVDEQRHTVRIGGGATWGQVADALAPHGLAISSGDTRSVGVGGLTLTGGIGWKVRKYGLALDNVVGAEVVTATGDVVRREREGAPRPVLGDPRWRWQRRDRDRLRVHGAPTTDVFHGRITFPASEAEGVLRGGRTTCAPRPTTSPPW